MVFILKIIGWFGDLYDTFDRHSYISGSISAAKDHYAQITNLAFKDHAAFIDISLGAFHASPT